MFVYVKDLCSMMDKEMRFVKEARETKENHEPQVYEDYMIKMQESLSGKLNKLKQISCNDKLIAKYEKMVKETF